MRHLSVHQGTYYPESRKKHFFRLLLVTATSLSSAAFVLSQSECA
jgi:hypothetical protein